MSQNKNISGEILAEYAKTGSHSCRGCGQTIAKNILKIGYIINLQTKKLSEQRWYHLSCLRAPPIQLKHLRAKQILGLKDLKKEDRENVKETFKRVNVLENQVLEETPKKSRRLRVLSPNDYTQEQIKQKAQIIYQLEMELNQEKQDKQEKVEKEQKPVKLEGWASKLEKFEQEEHKPKTLDDIFDNLISKVNYMQSELKTEIDNIQNQQKQLQKDKLEKIEKPQFHKFKLEIKSDFKKIKPEIQSKNFINSQQIIDLDQ